MHVRGAPRPLTQIVYRQARRGGGTETVRLPVGTMTADRLPKGCDAVILASDLQGVTPSPLGGDPVLLGIALADYLTVWAAQGLLPPPDRVGVILAGDLYSAPTADLRGASGDVSDVWLALAAAGCPLLVGVLGNHDIVGESFVDALGPGAKLLDGTVVEHGGVRIGGVGAIIGNPALLGRREEKPHLAAIDRVLAQDPDVLVLHEGPPGNRDQRGNPVIAERIGARPPALTVCGHMHWNTPTARLGDSLVINVDSRAIVLTT